MAKQINKIIQAVTLLILFLFPIAVSNVFPDVIQLPKTIILIFGLALIFLLLAVQIFVNGKIEITKSNFDIPIILIVLSYVASAIIKSPDKMAAFFNPGNATIIIGLGIFYFFINNIENREKVKLALVASGVVISLATILTFLGAFEKMGFLPAFVKTNLFNVTGDFLTSSIFLVIAGAMAVVLLIRRKQVVEKLVLGLSTAVLFIGIGISLFILLGSNKNAFPVLPPFDTSWSVAIETLKESPLFGVGASDYLTAFNRFRPLSYNSTPLWQLRFASARNLYLTVLTETGLFGILALGVLVFAILKNIEKMVKEKQRIGLESINLLILIGLLVLLAVFPVTAISLMVFVVFIALNSSVKRRVVEIGTTASNTPRVILALIIIGLIGFLAIKVRPVLLAEAKFKQAGDYLNANNGQMTYKVIGEAINLNPYVDKYHASYAQINLAIARSIASSKKDPKELTDEEKNTIANLIQQAIREGQATVSLNPTRAQNWEVLATVYQVVIPYAAQTDSFAIQSYNQTINLDPTNPLLRINLGQLFFSLGKYDDAISTLQFAVISKPDLANSHYNLSAAYREKGEIDKAIAEMEAVLTLVTDKNSSDYKLVQTELDNLKKKKASSDKATSSENLNTPAKSETQIDPAIKLPTNSSPPPAPNVPSPSPITSPTPNP